MRGKNFASAMKIIAYLNIFIFLYPVFIAIRYYFFHNTGGVLEAALLLFSMFFGLLATRFICRKEYYFTTQLLSYISVLIPILASVAVFHGNGAARAAFEIVISGVFYFAGSVNFSKSYSEVFNQKVLCADMIFLTAVFIFVTGISALNPIRNLIFVFILFNIPISMLIVSEGNIDQVFLTRGVEIPEVQRSIRKANIKLVVIFYAIILVLFNIKDLATVVVRYCVIYYFKIIYFILYLISILYPISQSSGGNGANAEPPQMDVRENNNIANMIFNIIAVLIILFILYKLIPIFVKKVAALIRVIKAKFKRKIKINDNKYNDNECEEIIEITRQSSDGGIWRKRRTNLFSLLRKAKDPAERIRLMYRIILTELGKKGVDITASDTAGQVLKKVQTKEGLKENMENITPIYEKIRYGEESPSEDALRAVEEGLMKITGKARV